MELLQADLLALLVLVLLLEVGLNMSVAQTFDGKGQRRKIKAVDQTVTGRRD